MIVGSVLKIKALECETAPTKPRHPTDVEPKPRKFDKVTIHQDYPDKKIQLRRKLPSLVKEEMTRFLSTHLHNFAGCTQDISGISPNIAKRRLNINPKYEPVKQKP